MKRSQIPIWFLWILIAFSGCVSPSPYFSQSDPQPTGEDELLFQQAEQWFTSGDMDQALAYYSRYLTRFPEGQQAEDALNRVAAIYIQQGEYDPAQAFYQRLVTQFPQSELADEARLAIIDLLILSNRPGDAIDQAQQMLGRDLDMQTRRQLWQRLADQYQSDGSLVNATVYAYMLYRSGPENEKEQWAIQLIEAIEGLNADDIDALWDRLDDDLVRAHLMYRYAVVQVIMENYDDALEALTALQEVYPEHIHAAEAAQLIDTLGRRLSFLPQTIGCLLPLSGPYKLYGQRALNGIELALSLMQSGEQQLPVKLVIKDSASEDGRAVAAVRALAEEQVGAIIGPIITAPAAAREAQKLHIPMVTFTQKPEITAIGDYIFRHFITPQGQVKALVDYFVNGVGLRDFAILYPQETYGQTFMTLFWDEVIRQGGRLVGVEAYEPQQTDFAATIQKLVGTYYPLPVTLQARSVIQVEEDPYFRKQSGDLSRLEDVLPDPVTRLTGLFFQDPDQARVKGPAIGRAQQQEEDSESIIDFDVLFIPDAPKTAGLILPQLAFHDIRDIYLVGTNLWHSQQLITMARDYAQNAVMADGFFVESQSQTVNRFIETYRKIYDSDPGIIEAFAFDTAWLMFKLMAQSDVQFRHTLRDTLRQVLEVDGVTGPTVFSENGEAIKHLTLLRVKGGRFIEVPRP